MTRRGLAGVYERHVFPWINDSVAFRPEFEAIRRETLAPSRGRVVEIGFGSGASLSMYPAAVTEGLGIEPNEGMLARAGPRLAAFGRPVAVVLAAGEHLPLADATADTVVSVLTMCSVSELGAVLSEVRRILRAGGQLLFAEHGLAEDPQVARWQHRLNPIQKVLACGCHLDRPVAASMAGAGFRFEHIRSFHVPGTPRTHGWLTAGRAVKAGLPA
jgi:SAM-dependent methyltransferase